jgi:hypothetical protein
MKRLMTILVVLAIVFVASVSANANVYVRGYYRSNGTYVQPHYRSNPDGNFYNNWSTYPNVNPYTGATGTRRTPSYNFGSYNSSSYYWQTPRYDSTGPTYWHGHSRNFPNLSSPRYNTLINPLNND